MGRTRIYQNSHDRLRAWRKKKKHEAKPYYAKRLAAKAQLADLARQEHKALEGVYDVLVIDPPWPVAFQTRETRPQQVSLAYPTMPVAEIQALTLPLAEDAHVWLWTTQRFIPQAFSCLDAWGLTYVCCFVWYKPGGMQAMGLPQFNCEISLYARKGNPTFLETTQFFTCFEAPRTHHSEKPACFYELVRRVTGGRRLDMFGRQARPGFDSWGWEAPDA